MGGKLITTKKGKNGAKSTVPFGLQRSNKDTNVQIITRKFV